MFYFIKFLTNLILPPGCLIILLLLSVIFLLRGKTKFSIFTVITCLLALYLSSIPLTASLLTHSLEYKYMPPTELNGDVIIMLGGGATMDTPDFSGPGNLSGSAANRLLAVARIYMKTNLPIILSGGQVFNNSGNESEIAMRQLMDLGVDKSKIIIENHSINTSENAKFTTQILKKYLYKRPILVTSAIHMQRAIINFHSEGVIIIVPYPVDYIGNDNITLSVNSFIPSRVGFYYTSAALHEYLGVLQLWIKDNFYTVL